MGDLFSPAERADLEARELPAPAVATVALADLEGAILLGAGIYSRMLLPHLQRQGIRPLCFVDSNPALLGTSLGGIEIRPLGTLARSGDRLVVAMTHHFRAMADILLGHGVARWAWFTGIREVFGNYDYVARAAQVAGEAEAGRLHDLLAPASREVLKRALACRVTGQAVDFPPPTPDQYFQEGIAGRAHYARFVDCGAYTGDTLQEWFRRFGPQDGEDRAYHAFEPDPDNFTCLEAARAALPESARASVHLHRSAVGRAEGRIPMVAGGLTTLLSEGLQEGVEVPVVRLDDALRGVPVTALKMDVEGFEPQILEGALDLIRTCRPLLLIAVYHQVRHLWELPLWVHDLDLGYRFEMRHHDTGMSETVCYAVPS